VRAEVREILDVQLADPVKARVLLPDGGSRRPVVSDDASTLQERLYALSCGAS